MNTSWLSWTPRPKNGRWVVTLPLPPFPPPSFVPPLVPFLYFVLPLDLAWHKYFPMIIPLAVSLSAPSALFFFIRSWSVKMSPNWPIYLLIAFIFPLHLLFMSSVSSLVLPSHFPQPFSLSFYHFSLSLPQSLLSAKESELQECQGRLAQLEEQLRAAQTGADRATIVRMKQVSFWWIWQRDLFNISYFGNTTTCNLCSSAYYSSL